MHDTREQYYFWQGYELALHDQLPAANANEWVWLGFGNGGNQLTGNLQATKWQARWKHFRDFFRINIWYAKGGLFPKMSLCPNMTNVRDAYTKWDRFTDHIYLLRRKVVTFLGEAEPL